MTPDGRRAARQARARLALAPRPVGWRTTDADEIALRRERAVAERMRVENLEPSEPVFSTFAVHSTSGSRYHVEIRSLAERENSCSCPDYRSNGLGTCKHVEAVQRRVRRTPDGRRAAVQGLASPRAEVFLRRIGEPEVALALPRARSDEPARPILRRYFDAAGRLQGDPTEAVPALRRELEGAGQGVRISSEVVRWAHDRARRVARQVERQAFLDDVRAGRRSLDLLGLPLYPYQVDGMLHLAFGERALLGDEMGLGKTVQAVAACALLRERRGIERVLVICPVSLKAEWEEQISKFTTLPLRFVQGTKASRLACYDAPVFFTIANYEQAVRDVADINRRLRPDVVVLDEAQRIKNWNTKTARAIKRIESPYAFLLTGTPIENRIDEIYSIVDHIDPEVFGPLFRFNREFYELDERGRPVGYRNLDELQRRIRPLLLRRRKDQVETQLPERVENNYFVPMSPAQCEMYDEYKARVARLLHVSTRRPLTREEQDKLQKWLACMRMLCDTPYILTPGTRDCPKVEELEAVLDDLDVRNVHKAIIFSEWERMLELVRELALAMGLGFAWHTGSVPQATRRDEIRRFKTDPACRLFLSTDSGGLGLNLQAASVVINLDLPWNPARLEQRIARAWRTHQTRSVHVINLISQGTIEHQMLGTLAAKRQLADGILDGRADLGALRMTSSRQGFLERMRLVFESTVAPAAATPQSSPPSLREQLATRLDGQTASRVIDVRLLADDAAATALIVVDRVDDALRGAVAGGWEALASDAGLPVEVEVVDVAAWDALQRLARRGLIPAIAAAPSAAVPAHLAARRRERAARLAEAARRKVRMAEVLAAGGFAPEAEGPVRDAIELALRAAAAGHGFVDEGDDGPVPDSIVSGAMLAAAVITPSGLELIQRLRRDGPDPAARDATFVEPGRDLVRQLTEPLRS